MAYRIPLVDPRLDGNEQAYVDDCLKSTWISGSGPYVERFEAAWAASCGATYGVACCNGTAALHLALLAVGVGPGDEVIVPDLTFVATANAVTYCGATPVFADVDPSTWCIDVGEVSRVWSEQTKVILPVHLYGHPADLHTLGMFDVPLIDDAAQAHGATSRHCRIGGILSDATAWSFHAAKIITTGEGGMVTTNNPDLAATMRLLREHGMDPKNRYWHPVVGYNYRLTNLHAAIGLAQVERIDELMAGRRRVVVQYRAALADTDLRLPNVPAHGENVCWLFSVILPDEVDRDGVIRHLAEAWGIETRPFFHPLHTLPPYRDHYQPDDFPVARHLAAHGLSLPTTPYLTEGQVAEVCSALRGAVEFARA